LVSERRLRDVLLSAPRRLIFVAVTDTVPAPEEWTLACPGRVLS
jgi:hypothetical protein